MLRFRSAREEDVPAVVAVVESAYRGEGSRAGWTTEADLIDGQRTDVGQVLSLLARPDSVILLAEIDGHLCGCCHLERAGANVVKFGMFAVSPQVQGGGIGKALIAEACRKATSWGCDRMEMSVVKQRADLIVWYQRLGFEPTGDVEPFPYGDDRFGRPRRPDLEFAVLAGSCQLPGRFGLAKTSD